MKNNFNHIRILVSLIILLLIPSVQCAEKIKKITLDDNVTFDLPANWVILEGGSRASMDGAVESALKRKAEGRTNFAANLYSQGGKVIAIVNLRFYPATKINQKDVMLFSREDISDIDQEIINEFSKVGAEAKLDFQPMPPTEKVEIGGVVVLKSKFKRKKQGTDEFTVQYSYRVLDGHDSFTLTVGYKESQEEILRPIVEKIAQSLRVKRH